VCKDGAFRLNTIGTNEAARLYLEKQNISLLTWFFNTANESTLGTREEEEEEDLGVSHTAEPATSSL